ncbi:MAG: right-handed parallel beta-helix repeat-containing protein [Calditrichaeota bacterium]|nr:right-handed parallel beta-helix repeat-containing protein [Calditrichota bacterium]
MTDARTVHHVDSSGAGAHATISAALAVAAPGDMIQISPGVYSESLKIDKEVELVGLGAHEDIKLTTERDSVITSTSAALVLKNLTLIGKVRTQSVVHVTAGTLDVRFCSIEGGKYSVLAENGARITIANSSLGEAERGALMAKHSVNVLVDNSLVERCGGSGVIAEGCDEVRVLYCSFNDTTPHAIECTGAGPFEVVDTEFSDISHAQILDNYKPIKFENEERSWYTRKLLTEDEA